VPIALSWSSGKDSAWTLHLLRQTEGVEIAVLITTFNEAANRVAMHAVRRELVETQAARVGLPIWSVDLPWPCANAVYEELMSGVCLRVVRNGVTAIAFGDLFLQDIRDYREKQLENNGSPAALSRVANSHPRPCVGNDSRRSEGESDLRRSR
jgi:diphthamide synthase (EF-2-diphthine--ammonia ligase)